MAIVVNTTISDSFPLRDNSNVALTGKVQADFSSVTAFDVLAPGTTAAVTLTEIGSGRYSISFIPTTPTTGEDRDWVCYVLYDSGGVFREFSETYTVTAVASTVTVVSAATSGALTQTLAELRRRVARRLGDYKKLTATANGTTTTVVDIQNVNTATEDMKGRVLVPSSGTNAGLKRFITAQVDATGTLTVAAMTTGTLANDTFDVYNKRGKGFHPDEYDAAINDAINDAYPLGRIEIRADITPAFDFDAPEVTVPASFTHVHTVEVSDDEGDWHVIMKAGRSNEVGWKADPTAGQIRILGYPGYHANDLTLRLTGYGRQDVLSADSDTCALNAEYIVARACFHLTYGNTDKDEKFSQTTTGFGKEAEIARTRMRAMQGMKSDSERVRAA